MAVKEFSIGFSRTINLGRYESARVEASVTYVIEGTSLTENVLDQAEEELRKLLERTWEKQVNVLKGQST
jgi:hypothetical protein